MADTMKSIFLRYFDPSGFRVRTTLILLAIAAVNFIIYFIRVRSRAVTERNVIARDAEREANRSTKSRLDEIRRKTDEAYDNHHRLDGDFDDALEEEVNSKAEH